MSERKFVSRGKTETPAAGVTVGRNPVSELLKSGRDIEKIYVLRGEREGSITKIVAIARDHGIVVDETDKKRLDELSGGANHQGVAAIASPVEYVSIESIVERARERGEKPLIVVCDGIEEKMCADDVDRFKILGRSDRICADCKGCEYSLCNR